MSDLVKRLRDHAGVLEHLGPIGYDKTLREAADAIEQAAGQREELDELNEVITDLTARLEKAELVRAGNSA